MTDKEVTRLHCRGQYGRLLADISGLLEQARRTAARSVNAVLTSAYWEIGRRIVEHEQHGRKRAGYGEQLIGRLSQDLTAKHGRGFSKRNLEQMRAFYLGWEIAQTPSAQFEARAICPVLPDAMGGIKAKVFASRYLTVLPDPETLRQEIVTTQRAIEARRRLE
jgi:hypothetical protein